MDIQGLSMDQAPPFRAVYRYLLPAPLFLVATGIAMALADASLFANFTQSKLIAIVHLLTLGFILLTIFGVLRQMMPVVAGVVVPLSPQRTLFFLFFYLPGIFLFAAAFFLIDTGQNPALAANLLALGLLLLGVSSYWYILKIEYHLFVRYLKPKTIAPGATVIALMLALAAIAVVVAIGLLMGYGRVTGHYFSWQPALLHLHLAWAFGGLILLPVIGISYRVIPMFFVAPDYPRWMQLFLTPALFATLVLFTFSGLMPGSLGSFFARGSDMAAFLAVFFAVTTLVQLWRKKRKLPDQTLAFWRLAMVMLVIFFLFYTKIVPDDLVGIDRLRRPVFLAALFLAGVAVSLIMGMLYKIVPFLVWFHLASRGNFSIPTVKHVISDGPIRLQFVLHAVFLLSFFISLSGFTSFSNGAAVSGVFLAIDGGFLFYQIFTSVRKYEKASRLEPGQVA